MTASPDPHILLSARSARRRVPGLWIAIGLFGLAFATFARTLGNEFINYDDPGYVTDNRHVREGLAAESVGWAFRDVSQSNWHPLTWLSHMLDVELYGDAPGGHHLTNVLLHAANSVLIFLLLKRMTARVWPCAVVAALFAVHPTHVESVAWISERKDVLSAFFALLTLWGYAVYVKRSAASTYAWTLLAFVLGLMSKPMLVTLPCVMLLLDVWPLQRLSRSNAWPRVCEKLPFVALAIAASVVAFIVQRAGGSVGTLDQYPLDRRAANAVVSVGQYLLKTVWPTELAIFYPYPGTFSTTAIVMSALLIVGITVIALMQRRKHPAVIVGWLWFLGMLVPVVGLVQIGRQSMADRYLYLPHIGLFIAVVWFVSDAVGRSRTSVRIAHIACGVIVLALAMKTVHQIGHWKNSDTLFTHALAVTDGNYLAHSQLANDLARRSRFAEAESHYRQALAILPDHPWSHMNLGKLLARRNEDAQAVRHLREAVRVNPTLADAQLSLGFVLARQGELADAEKAFAAALRIDPELAMAHYQWGIALREAGQQNEAAEHFRAALEIDPDFAAALDALRPLQQPATRPI